jgi:NADPH-dependent ferric siderophore reductase
MAPELVDRFALRARVTAVERAAARTRLIRIAGPALEGLHWIPGQHVRVLTGGPLQHLGDLLRTSLRSYSIWSYTGDQIELCVYEHAEDGPGTRWAAGLSAGDEVSFRRPEGRLVLDRVAPYHLFVGEETATVAFGAMLRALPDDADAHAVLEAVDADARLALPGKAATTWVDRGRAPAAGSTLLVEALRAAELPEGAGVAYVAGEARTCQAVRTHLVRERGWPRRAVIVKPFWSPGKRGME